VDEPGMEVPHRRPLGSPGVIAPGRATQPRGRDGRHHCELGNSSHGGRAAIFLQAALFRRG
jgi:hypothetical protein